MHGAHHQPPGRLVASDPQRLGDLAAGVAHLHAHREMEGDGGRWIPSASAIWRRESVWATCMHIGRRRETEGDQGRSSASAIWRREIWRRESVWALAGASGCSIVKMPLAVPECMHLVDGNACT